MLVYRAKKVTCSALSWGHSATSAPWRPSAGFPVTSPWPASQSGGSFCCILPGRLRRLLGACCLARTRGWQLAKERLVSRRERRLPSPPGALPRGGKEVMSQVCLGYSLPLLSLLGWFSGARELSQPRSDIRPGGWWRFQPGHAAGSQCSGVTAASVKAFAYPERQTPSLGFLGGAGGQ